MTNSNKQVLDIHASKGIDIALSDEHQRNWDDHTWHLKLNHDAHNYNRSRSIFNFEIAKGCIIQPIDTGKSEAQRFRECLESRGITDPNIGRSPPNRRTVANLIFEGSRERMREMAFEEELDWDNLKADHSYATRSKVFEDWAKDMYRFVADRFGEENIIGFYAHLDESNPHLHCAIVPVTPQNKISWKYWFSRDSLAEGRKLWRDMHTELAKVNAKYGLERGEDIHDTGAKHIPLEDYRYMATALEKEVEEKKTEINSLNRDIGTVRKKIKSFTKMFSNLNSRKETLEEQLDKLKKLVGASPDDSDEDVLEAMKAIKEKLDEIKLDIAKREAQLHDANDELAILREEKRKLEVLKSSLINENIELLDSRQAKATIALSNDSISLFSNGISRLLPTLSTPQLKTLFSSDSDLFDPETIQKLAENMEEAVTCAAYLYVGMIDAATTYCESHGGKSSPGSGWGKRDDDDDERWRRRCLAMGAKMMGSRSKGRKR